MVGNPNDGYYKPGRWDVIQDNYIQGDWVEFSDAAKNIQPGQVVTPAAMLELSRGNQGVADTAMGAPGVSLGAQPKDAAGNYIAQKPYTPKSSFADLMDGLAHAGLFTGAVGGGLSLAGISPFSGAGGITSSVSDLSGFSPDKFYGSSSPDSWTAFKGRIDPSVMNGGGNMGFDPTADFGADYFSGANNYGTSAWAPNGVDEFGNPIDNSGAQYLKPGESNTVNGNPNFNTAPVQEVLKQLNSVPGGGSLVQRLLSGDGSLSDYARIASLGLGAAIPYFAGQNQAAAQKALAASNLQFGAPSRARFEQSMTPGFDPTSIPGYSGAVDTASKSLLARLSATGGNPFGQPGGLIDANKQIIAGTALPAINNYQAMNLNAGYGPGFGASNTASMAAINSDAGSLAGVTGALGQIAGTDGGLSEFLKKLTGTGQKYDPATGFGLT